VVIDFRVEQEDTVYPMVPAGADLDQMIRRPDPTPLADTGDEIGRASADPTSPADQSSGGVEVSPKRDQFGRASADPLAETGADV